MWLVGCLSFSLEIYWFSSFFLPQKIVSKSCYSDQWEMHFNFWSKLDRNKSLLLPLPFLCSICWLQAYALWLALANQRIVAVEKQLWRSSGPTLCSRLGQLAQVTQGHDDSGCKYLQSSFNWVTQSQFDQLVGSGPFPRYFSDSKIPF